MGELEVDTGALLAASVAMEDAARQLTSMADGLRGAAHQYEATDARQGDRVQRAGEHFGN